MIMETSCSFCVLTVNCTYAARNITWLLGALQIRHKTGLKSITSPSVIADTAIFRTVGPSGPLVLKVVMR